ncbi:MAG: hypothetical protein QN183_09415 [Armatimonadota bacterium]|nr:hypothetical protein [Armatimonadota bacterium]MDR7533311.1 hypothetical protein [Armatimonadota bacterium]MDR7536570.1 hypothetical protein [Armatimonadota bacterium]
MEIDLDRARRAIVDLGAALAEARGVVRVAPDSVVRIRTESEVIELPVSWAVAGLVAFAAAALLSAVPVPTVRRRSREEEPLGIG